MDKLDVLALAAHPDDTELCCSGTLAKLVEQGCRVGVIDFTQGEKGTRGTPEQRLQEAQDASRILGLEVRENLGLPDTKIENSRTFQKPVIQKIRQYQPHICLVSAPFDRHPDHGNAASLQIDSLFYSGLREIETTDEDGNAQSTWRPSHILHYMQDRPFDPDFVFDISETLETKIKAIQAFKSQFYSGDASDEEGPETYISSKNFFKGIKARARHYGHLAGVTYGEPFKYYQRPTTLNSFQFLFDTNPKR